MSSQPTKSPCRKHRADDAKPCSVLMPLTLQERLIQIAKQQDRSFSATVRRALEAFTSHPV